MAKLEIISDSDSKFKDLPGASTILDIKTIKLLNPIGTQEMLEYVPGVNGFSDDGIGNSRISVGIRGINQEEVLEYLFWRMVYQFNQLCMYIPTCIIIPLQSA